jgi:hypothetical protein
LDLPVPIWVSDLAFVRNSEQIATSSRHGFVSYIAFFWVGNISLILYFTFAGAPL